MQENLWNDRVVLAFLFLCFFIFFMLREIWKAQEAYEKFGEYQDTDLDEHERRLGE